MKKYFRILAVSLLALSAVAINGCKKDDDDPSGDTLFLEFDFDGDARSFKHTHGDLYFWGNYSESYIGYSDNGIILSDEWHNMEHDSIQNLVGRKLPMSNSITDSHYKGRVVFDEGSDYYDSDDADNNTFPANYFKITKVTLTNTETSDFQINYFYLLEGEFVCNVNAGGSDVPLTNGKFKVGFVVYEFL
jgi:hypothetical protein